MRLTLPGSFLAGLFLACALVLAAARPAAAASAVLDWDTVNWPPGSLVSSYTLGNGITVTINISTSAAGSFTNGTPQEDCSTCSINFLGLSHDLGIIFDPSGPGASPVITTVTFSAPVTQLKFEISDIDFSIGGAGQDYRLDQVVITSDAGDPVLTPKTGGSHTFTISGNTATANCSNPGPPNCNPTVDTTDQTSDSGTIVIDFGAKAVSTMTITYNETSGQPNPAGRGVGILGNLVETPVELTSFTIE